MSKDTSPPAYKETTGSNEMPLSTTTSTCPNGLESLRSLNLIKIEKLVTFIHSEYLIRNSTGNEIFYAKTASISLNSLGTNISFTMILVTPDGKTVMTCECRVNNGWKFWEKREVSVRASDKYLGSISPPRGFIPIDYSYRTYDENGQAAFVIDCMEIDFLVRRASDRLVVAKISRSYRQDMALIAIPSEYSYKIEFLTDLSPQEKAIIIGTILLMGFNSTERCCK